VSIDSLLFLGASAIVMALSIRQLYMSRTIRRLEEENFDLRFQIEVLEARSKGLVEVHPFKGDQP
jgi:hypothetical protein